MTKTIIDKLKLKATAWEAGFLTSIEKKTDTQLSSRQSDILRKIYKKYGEKWGTPHSIHSPPYFLPLKPRKWQLEAYDKWAKSDFKGTIEAGTGAGKTYLGLMAILKKPSLKTLIVVPTIHLQLQWKSELEKKLRLFSVGLIGGGEKELSNRIVIAVVNSIRFEDLNQFDLVILDEAHRYMSDINKLFLTAHEFKEVLAISATIKRDDKLHEKFIKKYPIVYSISQKECIKEGYLCGYRVLNIGLDLSKEERKLYDDYDDTVKSLIRFFDNNIHKVISMVKLGNKTAADIMRAVNKRRGLVLNNDLKIEKAAEIIINSPKDIKTIVFGEFKNSANKLFKILKSKGINAGLYHTGLGTGNRQETLEQYKRGEFSTLISVKALDEGLDAPSTQRAIIMGGSSVKRQMIQRLGRVLRAEEGKEAEVIQLYIKNTKDEDWVRERTKPFEGVAKKIEWS